MENSLDGKIAIVTGGSRGIGAAIVEALLREGMIVWTTGRSKENLDALTKALISYEARLKTAVCNSRVPDEIEMFFAEMENSCPRLDVLVGNAGVGKFGSVEEVSQKDWDEVMEINGRGTFLFAQQAFRWMKRCGGGRIINIASVVGLRGYPKQSQYTASKHAVVGMTKVLAREGQPFGIRASVICPGGVATDLVLEARPDLDVSELIHPEDVARAVLYIAKEPESCCTDLIQLRRTGSLPFG
jgi:3-oxoacyl-[acyl-carrier protein] reductase